MVKDWKWADLVSIYMKTTEALSVIPLVGMWSHTVQCPCADGQGTVLRSLLMDQK